MGTLFDIQNPYLLELFGGNINTNEYIKKIMGGTNEQFFTDLRRTINNKENRPQNADNLNTDNISELISILRGVKPDYFDNPNHTDDIFDVLRSTQTFQNIKEAFINIVYVSNETPVNSPLGSAVTLGSVSSNSSISSEDILTGRSNSSSISDNLATARSEDSTEQSAMGGGGTSFVKKKLESAVSKSDQLDLLRIAIKSDIQGKTIREFFNALLGPEPKKETISVKSDPWSIISLVLPVFNNGVTAIPEAESQIELSSLVGSIPKELIQLAEDASKKVKGEVIMFLSELTNVIAERVATNIMSGTIPKDKSKIFKECLKEFLERNPEFNVDFGIQLRAIQQLTTEKENLIEANTKNTSVIGTILIELTNAAKEVNDLQGEKKELENKIQKDDKESFSSLNTSTADLVKKNGEIAEKSLEIEGLTTQLSSVMNEKEKIKSELLGIVKEKEALGLSIELLTEQLKGVMRGNTRLRGEITELTGEITGLKGEITGLQDEITGLSDENADLKSKAQEIMTANVEFELFKEGCKQEKSKILTDHMMELLETNRKLSAITSENKNLQKLLTSTTAYNTRKENTIVGLQNQIKELEDQITLDKQTSAHSSVEIEDKDTKIANLKSLLDNLSNKSASESREIEALKVKLTNQSSANSQETTALQSQIDNLENSVISNEGTLIRLSQVNDTLKEQIATINSTFTENIKEQEDRINALTQQVSELEKDKTITSTKIVELKDYIKDIVLANEELSQFNSKYEVENNENKKDLNQQDKDIKLLNLQNSKLEKLTTTLVAREKKYLLEHSIELDRLKSKIKRDSARMDALRDINKELYEELFNKKKTFEGFMKDASGKLEIANFTIDKVQDQFGVSQRNVIELTAKIKLEAQQIIDTIKENKILKKSAEECKKEQAKIQNNFRASTLDMLALIGLANVYTSSFFSKFRDTILPTLVDQVALTQKAQQIQDVLKAATCANGANGANGATGATGATGVPGFSSSEKQAMTISTSSSAVESGNIITGIVTYKEADETFNLSGVDKGKSNDITTSALGSSITGSQSSNISSTPGSNTNSDTTSSPMTQPIASAVLDGPIQNVSSSGVKLEVKPLIPGLVPESLPGSVPGSVLESLLGSVPGSVPVPVSEEPVSVIIPGKVPVSEEPVSVIIPGKVPVLVDTATVQGTVVEEKQIQNQYKEN